MSDFRLSQLPFLDSADPLHLSHWVLQLTGTKLRVSGRHHIPQNAPLLVVSNHRSPLDAPVLMVGLDQEIAFVCHQYMMNVPVLRDIVHQFGAFPLESPRRLFRQGYQRLRRCEAVGIFPEGAKSMVQLQPPQWINPFRRGFAHLALRAPIDPLALLPVAIASNEVGFESPIPLSLLAWFDPSESLFHKGGGHPVVLYREVEVRIGQPIWVTSGDREKYQRHQGTEYAQVLTERCWTAVDKLLQESL
ncbi:lysophospholipid acyltransferase family protein [Oscillatoria sp. CS-180]|uniref:lysophospholipid acyltransferase family protein n=1 Tax=Oscillatoria sp. CS-180 TaxID=3021720 RepID=UPI00232AADE8|nr:lysophospholipid acyltransferase family protein [Oscillatoria sp. CS-180]MDB9525625.1 lysophospholipid acyltransferase family protein [Oscillatoria sp. CS-180]